MTNDFEQIFGGDKYVSVSIARFEGDRAVIKIDDGQELSWPKEKLPAGAKEGDMYKLAIISPEMESAEREKTAKIILSEILKADET